MPSRVWVGLIWLLALTIRLAPLAAEEARLGRVEMANSGSASAQAPFLQGLAALHSFWYDEAADSFLAAQRIDPSFALAYWGEAMTHNHPIWREVDLEAARAVLSKLAPTPAERAAKAPTEREQMYLAAAEVLFGEGEKKARDRAYADAMEQLHRRFPEDREAASFYALSLQGMQEPGSPDARLQMRSAAILEEVFADNPLHPGAAHYLIHAYDDPVHAPLGLRAARVYAGIAPAAHHALHMPSHIFVQLGMWDEVAASNVSAYEASLAWQERRKHPIAKRDFHSLSWLHYAYLQLGRLKEAEATLRIAEEASPAGGSRVADAAEEMRARHLVETGAAPTPLVAARPPSAEVGADGGHACAAYSPGSGGASALFVRGLAALAQGNPLVAQTVAGQLKLLASSSENPRVREHQVLERELAAAIELAAGRVEEGLAALAEAVRVEETLPPPSGPPSPIRPAHEAYGEALLGASRFGEAAAEFEKALLRTPNRPSALLGSARGYAGAGKSSLARERYAALAAIWHGADADFAPRREVLAFLGAHPAERPAP